MSSDRRVAIITGSSRGIGRAVAIRLAQDGHNVVINYQSSAGKAQEVVDIIHNTTASKAIAVQADVGNLADGQKLIDESLKAFGRIDIVVFNAAWIFRQSVHDVTEESYEEAFRTNVKAPMFFTQQLTPHLKAGSRLVYVSTVLTSVSTVQPNFFLYSATKGAVEQMTRTLAQDLGSKGITVNCVNPGPTDTDSFRNGLTEQQIQFVAGLSPVGRLGQPEDIAAVISFLAGESSAWVNGQILGVNGGLAV
ncbi:NAD-P-binding protein [Dissophora ornata]|nr:NAD-P-binding protein [Dissophora ornata]